MVTGGLPIASASAVIGGIGVVAARPMKTRPSRRRG
jgi:uncharacterized protein GlcG (DUF336 family)